MREKTIELIYKLGLYISRHECTLEEAAVVFGISQEYASQLMKKEYLQEVCPFFANWIRKIIESHRPYPGIRDATRHLDPAKHPKILYFADFRNNNSPHFPKSSSH